MKRKVAAGTTGMILSVFVADTSSTIGAGLAITHASSGLVFEYRRAGDSSWTSVTPVAGTLGTYTSGGIVADGSLTGAYEIGIPNAALAVGARAVYVRLRGVANMFPVQIEIELDRIDYQDPTRAGLTGLSANAPGATGGMALVGSAMTLTSGERTAIANEVEAQIIDDTDSEKVLEAIVNKINAMTDLDALTLSAIATAVRTELATELARIDVTISSRLAAAGYTAPDNATITANNAIVTALQNRVGAFTGSGDNTILGVLRAIASKSAPTPSDIGGTFTSTTDSLEAIADNVIAAGLGARSVVITVNDGTNPIFDARVRLTKGAETYALNTDINGQVSFNVDDGTWTVSITANRYTFAGASLVVDGSETRTYSMTLVSIAPPAEPGLCTVRFEVRDADGTTPVQGASVKAILDQNNTTDGILLSNAVHSGTTNSSGICDLVLVQGKSIIRGNKLYTITATDPGSTTSEPLLKITGVVPNKTTAYASELIPRNM
jgi:hypothetical protein